MQCVCGIALLYFSKLHTKFFRFSWPNIYLALLNAALPSNDDLGARLFLHVLQCVPSRTWYHSFYQPSLNQIRIIDDVLVLDSNEFRKISNQKVLPMSRPTKLISGCSSWGIITLSDTFTVGALHRTTDLRRRSLSHRYYSTSSPRPVG